MSRTKKSNEFQLTDTQKEVLSKLTHLDQAVGLSKFMLQKHGLDYTSWENVRSMMEYILVLLSTKDMQTNKKLNIVEDEEEFENL